MLRCPPCLIGVASALQAAGLRKLAARGSPYVVGLLLGTVALAGCGSGTQPTVSAGALARSVSQTDQTWTCSGPVNLDSVQITITAEAGGKKKLDAVKFAPGCTGKIGKIDITQNSADAIKVAQGAHDITVGGGTIKCLAKGEDLHQDGIQVMGGARITFKNLSVDCGRPNESLINSNMFLNMAGDSTEPPTDVVCDHCDFGGDAGHTVSIQKSIRSGVTDSTLCPAKYPEQTLAVGVDAVDPIVNGNTTGSCPDQSVSADTPVEPTFQKTN